MGGVGDHSLNKDVLKEIQGLNDAKEVQPQPQSRLSKWKLPAEAEPRPLAQSHSTPNLQHGNKPSTSDISVGLLGDATWRATSPSSAGRDWPITTSASDNEPRSGAESPTADAIEEFVPGKPWTGNKVINPFDPDITPGQAKSSK